MIDRITTHWNVKAALYDDLEQENLTLRACLVNQRMHRKLIESKIKEVARDRVHLGGVEKELCNLKLRVAELHKVWVEAGDVAMVLGALRKFLKSEASNV